MPWILRDTPQPLWSQLQEKARREGWPLKALILNLVKGYVDGQIAPSGSPPLATPPHGRFMVRCPNGHEYPIYELSKNDMRALLDFGGVICSVCRAKVDLTPIEREALERWVESPDLK